jgi:hypothetical protein
MWYQRYQLTSTSPGVRGRVFTYFQMMMAVSDMAMAVEWNFITFFGHETQQSCSSQWRHTNVFIVWACTGTATMQIVLQDISNVPFTCFWASLAHFGIQNATILSPEAGEWLLITEHVYIEITTLIAHPLLWGEMTCQRCSESFPSEEIEMQMPSTSHNDAMCNAVTPVSSGSAHLLLHNTILGSLFVSPIWSRQFDVPPFLEYKWKQHFLQLLNLKKLPDSWRSFSRYFEEKEWL